MFRRRFRKWAEREEATDEKGERAKSVFKN
jgi:hypothetical protein